jgi:putative mRNA 3-end processing factor
VSGDYKMAPDPTCRPFEPLKCHGFVTESTFGLPIYRWKEPTDLLADIHGWWRENQERGRTCVLFAYALGKAQRILCQLDPATGPILLHGAIDRYLNAYQAAGISLPPTERVTDELARATRGRALVLAPPSAQGSIWIRKFGEISTAIASGWMQTRGTRRRKAVDRGFPLSDHADWDGLRTAVDASGAEHVWVTHGYSQVMARWLNEQGRAAHAIATRFEGELETDLEGEGSGSVTASQVSTSASDQGD